MINKIKIKAKKAQRHIYKFAYFNQVEYVGSVPYYYSYNKKTKRGKR